MRRSCMGRVGTAEDSSGSIVPGAPVTVSNESTGVTKQGTTDQDGNFSFTDLLPGAYTVKVTAKGFRTAQVAGVQVSINSVSRVGVTLQVGELAETVTVSSDAAVLQTDQA